MEFNAHIVRTNNYNALQNMMEIVRRITKYVPFTSRVMIDLTSKPPGTTEWE